MLCAQCFHLFHTICVTRWVRLKQAELDKGESETRRVSWQTRPLSVMLTGALTDALTDALTGALTGALTDALSDALTDALSDALTGALTDALTVALSDA